MDSNLKLYIAESILNILRAKGLITEEERQKIREKNKFSFLSD